MNCHECLTLNVGNEKRDNGPDTGKKSINSLNFSAHIMHLNYFISNNFHRIFSLFSLLIFDEHRARIFFIICGPLDSPIC